MKKLNKIILLSSILVIILIIISVVVVLTVKSDDDVTEEVNPEKGDPLQFEEFLSRKFAPRGFNASWNGDSKLVWKDVGGNLVEFDVESGMTNTLVANTTMAMISSTASFVSFAPNNRKWLLFTDNRENIWRHSFYANYIVLDADKGVTYPIEPRGEPKGTKLRYAEWRAHPTSDQIIFSWNNNIYLREDIKDSSKTIELTTDGVVDKIYNGIPDWVYEEEVLSTNKALHLSPNGDLLAFAQFNDSQVDSFYYTMYGDPKKPMEHRYTEQIKLPYPKVGTANPSVKIFVKDLNDASSNPVELKPPVDLVDFIYFRIYWISSQKLGIIWENRIQNHSFVSECTQVSLTWQCDVVTKHMEDNGWLLIQTPMYSSDGSAFLQILPQLRSEDGLHYQHLALVNKSQTTFYSSGPMAVTEVLMWDEFGKRVYFVGTEANEPGTRHLYEANTESKTFECRTCNMSLANATHPDETCRYNNFYVSPNLKFYVQVCKGPHIGEIVVRRLSDNSIVRVMDNFQDIRDQFQGRSVPEKRMLKVGVSEKFAAPVKMTIPENFDQNKKYPVLVYVYGGPESQMVDYRYSMDWGEFLVTNYDIVYVSIDGRGTGFQSNEFTFQVYKDLGNYEMVDQIGVTKELLKKYPNLDSTRVGIWGWSYGGYATLKTLSMDTDNVFKCGISVAPPTDWLFYDTIYTERFMSTPDDNPVGYNRSSLLDKVENLRGKNFMINHGVADDNVHYQNSMMLIKSLELADVPFLQNSYPDENHGLGNVKRFLYHIFDSFWTNCFNIKTSIKKM